VKETSLSRPLIAPFVGIRYQGEELSDLLCPPYDIISHAEQEALYSRHPHNMVRLEFPLPEEEGGPYAAAACSWEAWRESGVLQQDPEPAFYVLQTDFTLSGRPCRRLGLFVGLHLESLQDGRVLPHEGTLAAAKADRLAMLEATWANFSPIWGMYHNPAVAALLPSACAGEPVSRAEFADGSRCALWRVSDPETIAIISNLLGEGPVFIADGHHRYETAFAFSQKHPAAEPPAPVNYLLTLLVEAQDEGLIILPTHRAISGLDEAALEKMWVSLEQTCELKSAPDLAVLLTEVEQAEHTFGVYTKEKGAWLIELKQVEPETPPVKLLHKYILEPALCDSCKFGYFKEAEKAIAAVEAGEYQAAFFLRSLRSEELIRAALAKERLPGKSTYFWPKIPAGLVMRSLRS
jgi:uncharacterized protein (DUF1015 family)